MSKRRVLSFKSQPRLEWGGQDGQHETEKPDHLARLGDSVTSSTRDKVFGTHRYAVEVPSDGLRIKISLIIRLFPNEEQSEIGVHGIREFVNVKSAVQTNTLEQLPPIRNVGGTFT